LEKHLLVLVFFVESWGNQLLTPPWVMSPWTCIPEVLGILIDNSALVINWSLESPDVLFIKSMIDSWGIRVWWVSVNWFTLNIIEWEFSIVIFNWEDWRSSYSSSLFRFVLFHSLECVSFHERNIVHIIMEFRILSDRLMETNEWVIKNMVTLGSSD
jgi:hypothetical protein